MHQFVDQRCDQEQYYAGAQQGPEAEGVAGQRRLNRHAAFAADVAGEDTRQVVADTGGQEPAAHAQANQTYWRQFGDHRQADRRQAQLADRLQHVDGCQGPERDLVIGANQARQCKDQQAEGQRIAQQAQAEFARDRRVDVVARQEHPDGGNHGRQDDDGDRVDGLEVGGREDPEAQVAVDDVFSQEGKRAACLFEEHPEQDVEGEDQQHGDDFVTCHFAIAHTFDDQHHCQDQEQRGQDDLQRFSADGQQEVHQRDHAQAAQGHPDDAFRAFGADFWRADAFQGAAADEEPDQADQHAEAGSDEYHLVGRHGVGAEDRFGQPLGDHWRDQGAHIDTHVEDREATVAALIGSRIQLADHGRDVRLEHAVTDDHRCQAQVEDILVWYGDAEQAGSHEGGAQQDGALVADDTVGDIAAEQGAGIHQREEGTVGQGGRSLSRSIAAMELGHDVQYQRPANSVEREAFPEFSHEQHPQWAWMAHNLLELGNNGFLVGRSRTAHAVPPENYYSESIKQTYGIEPVQWALS